MQAPARHPAKRVGDERLLRHGQKRPGSQLVESALAARVRSRQHDAVGLRDVVVFHDPSSLQASERGAFGPLLARRGRACVSLRVKAEEFSPGRTLRRIARRSEDVVADARPPHATPEQYALFRAYVGVRHHDGGMADMSMMDFQMMVEDSHVETGVTEYRERETGRLLACCLTDRLADGLSMVYSFYDPALAARSLGVFMILDHVARAREQGLEHLYLGYWVEGSSKMDYKSRYLPQDRLGMDGWSRVG